MNKTKIAWTDFTWNPLKGCTKESEGCLHCYAEKTATWIKRLGTVPHYSDGFKPTVIRDCFNEPCYRKKPATIFVCSMSDIFHRDFPDSVIMDLFAVMNNCPQHTFQILTKRAARIPDIDKKVNWTNNICLGVTVESNKYYNRIKYLQGSSAKSKFLSLEPLLSDMQNLPLEGIDWVIVGGEHASEFRYMDEDWVRHIRDQVKAKNIPFFYKQTAGVKPVEKPFLDGRQWLEMPEHKSGQLIPPSFGV